MQESVFPLQQFLMRNSRRLISHGIEGIPARDITSTLSPMLLMRHVQESESLNIGAVQTLILGPMTPATALAIVRPYRVRTLIDCTL
jgi:hypothetical protein